MPTEQEIDDAKDAVLADVARGVEEMRWDGKLKRAIDPLTRLKAIDLLDDVEDVAVQPHRGLRFTKLIPPGGGG